MKIVLLYLGRKGAGPLYSIEFAKALLGKGISLFAIVSSYSENIQDWRTLSEEFGQSSFILKEIPTYRGKRDFIFRSFNIKLFCNLISAIKRFRPDCIFSTMVHPWHNVIFAILGKSIKRIKIIHDVQPHKGEDSFMYRILNRGDIRIADFWIVLTNLAKKQLVEQGIDAEKICIIPHANFGGYASDSITLSTNIVHRIAFIGRINKYKGVDVLLKAFQQVLHYLPDLKLIIAGSGDCSEYMSMIERLGVAVDLQNRWIADEEIPLIIDKVDFVVLPYIEATQSGVIPLSFAFGKTVIATNVGGIPEQVPPGVGVLVPSSDSVALGNAILNMYEQPEQIIKMGLKAYSYAHNELSWAKSAALFIDFYRTKICL